MVGFEKTTNDFKAAGKNINKQKKVRYLLRALFPSYSYIGDFIDAILEEQRTVDHVKSKIKEKNITATGTDKKSNINTFLTKSKAQCFTSRRIVGIVRKTTKKDIQPVNGTKNFKKISRKIHFIKIKVEAGVKIILQVRRQALGKRHRLLKYVIQK